MTLDRAIQYLVFCNSSGINKVLAGLVLYSTTVVHVWAQVAVIASDIAPGENDPQRTELVEPFRIIGNIYHVGAKVHYPAFLITTPEGHILIDTTYEDLVAVIQANIEKLGFSVEDIKLLLTSHAHHDHVGGHALMQEITGATMVASGRDKEVIETGGKADFRDGDFWAPAKVDRLVEDLEKIQLGGTVIQAHLTPGHTKGCTTWTTVVEEKGQKYDVVILCGMRMNAGEAILGNPDYPDMAEDFAYAFAKLKILPVDVTLGVHGYWFNLGEKIKLMQQGTAINPFIDAEGYRKTIEGWEKAYLQQLKAERGMGTRVP